MTKTMASRWVILLFAPLLLALAACDRDHDEDFHGIERAEIWGAADNELYAYYEAGDVTWQEVTLPTVAVGETLSLEARFYDEDETQLPLEGDTEYGLQVVVAPEGIVDIDVNGATVDIQGLEVGQTEAAFSLLHGDHVDETSPTLALVVGAVTE